MSDWKKDVEAYKAGLSVEEPRISTLAIRFGFFGLVAGGKSVTAGIFAAGITPAPGLIGWIDGEGKRSGWAIDTVADMASKFYGGSKDTWVARFKVVHVDPPFNPLRVVAALELLEESCNSVIMDVMSQAWDSEGGYLDLKDEKLERMAGADEQKRMRSAAAAAAAVKPWTHQKLVNKVNTSKCNLVLLFQAKAKFDPGKSKPNEFVSPIQESGLTRTALAVGRVEADSQGVGGICHFQLPSEQGTKFTHPNILAALPANGERLTFQHGENILRLCVGHVKKSTTPPEKKALWDATRAIRQAGDNDWTATQQWLWDEGLMTPEENIRLASTARLLEVTEAARNKIATMTKP